ncbi:MAG: glucosaminidase domain-containing protein [Tenacibaculum sp.]
MNIKILAIVVLILLLACKSKKRIVEYNKKELIELKENPFDNPTSIKQHKKINTPKTSQTIAYIKKFAPIAIKKMKEHNIPASITLAQGILESGSGRSRLAVKANNHFGIKCHKNWKGKIFTHDDDKKGECFRKYKYPEDSYEDHSQFLLSRKRYANLFKLKPTDYQNWAFGLKKSGYATDKKYPEKLIRLINKYNLVAYDNLNLNNNNYKNTQKITTNYYLVKKGDTLYAIAKKYQVSIDQLKIINNLKSNYIQIGQELQIP